MPLGSRPRTSNSNRRRPIEETLPKARKQPGPSRASDSGLEDLLLRDEQCGIIVAELFRFSRAPANRHKRHEYDLEAFEADGNHAVVVSQLSNGKVFEPRPFS